jgi:hypothetical protein
MRPRLLTQNMNIFEDLDDLLVCVRASYSLSLA